MLDMGFAEDLEHDPFGHARGPPDGALLRDDLADRSRGSPSATCATRPGSRVQAEKATADGVRARPPGRLRRAARGQARRAVPHPRRGGPDVARWCSPGPVARSTTSPRRLSGRGHDAGALHGGLAQEQRDRIMGRFRDGALDVLVATDVAARGLDIEHVSHVVNYDVPSDPDAYVHRIGRTGRAGREGVAITLVEPREHRLLRNIESATRPKLEIARLPTVADLRERRLELLRATLRDALVTDGLDRLRGVVEPLTEEFDVVDIALAAVSLIEGAETRDEDEVELAQASFQQPGPGPSRGPGGPGPRGPGRSPGGGPPRRGPGGPRSGPGRFGPGPGARAPRGPEADGWEQLWIGGGRRAGLRPGDLVGAIANEAGVPGSVVGAIQLFDDFALVDVQGQVADAVEHALRNATIRGQRLPVRRERSPGRR